MRWNSLRDVPKHKTISLGLIDVRDPQVETVDELTQQARHRREVRADGDLGICPNCGFSGAGADAWIDEDAQRRKLDVMVETARRVSG